MFKRNLILVGLVLCMGLFTALAQAQPAQVIGGLNYLSSSQNADGTWGNTTASVETTAVTVTGVEALKSLSQNNGSAFTNASAWLQGQAPTAVDYLAQRIHALGLTDSRKRQRCQKGKGVRPTHLTKQHSLISFGPINPLQSKEKRHGQASANRILWCALSCDCEG